MRLSDADLKYVAARRTALQAFEMHIQLIDLMKTMEPELYSFCIRELRATMYPEFKLRTSLEIQSMCPQFVPDVFKRLWNKDVYSRDEIRKKDIKECIRLRWQN